MEFLGTVNFQAQSSQPEGSRFACPAFVNVALHEAVMAFCTSPVRSGCATVSIATRAGT